MFRSFVFENFRLFEFNISIKLPRLLRLLKADHPDLVDKCLVCPHTFNKAALFPETIMRLNGDLCNFVFLHFLQSHLNASRYTFFSSLAQLELDSSVIEHLVVSLPAELNL